MCLPSPTSAPNTTYCTGACPQVVYNPLARSRLSHQTNYNDVPRESSCLLARAILPLLLPMPTETTVPEQDPLPSTRLRHRRHLALAVLDCPSEPWRVGERILLDEKSVI